MIAGLLLFVSGCATNSQTYSKQAKSLEETKVTTPTYQQSGLMIGQITLWPDGSERTGRVKSPGEDAWKFAGKVLDKGPLALLSWLGFDYLKKDSSNDAATAQSRPPVVRPEVVNPEVVEPTIIETPSPQIVEVPSE